MDLKRLREATRPEHEATEAAMPLFDVQLTRERYAEVLHCLLPILRSWERWSAANAPGRLRYLLAPRRRSHLLIADLRSLGEGGSTDDFGQVDDDFIMWSSVVNPGALAHGDSFAECEARFLGALYVLEGSTLGGRFLARQVETVLGLTPGQGNAYFVGHGPATSALWKELTAEIAAVPEVLSDDLVGAAQRTFVAFREALEHYGPFVPAAATGVTTTATVAGTRQDTHASKVF